KNPAMPTTKRLMTRWRQKRGGNNKFNMKKTSYLKIVTILLLLVVSIHTLQAQIQPDPAHWAYGIKKLDGNLYEVHLRCTIDDGWHIYAQKQGKDFIGTRTKIVIQKTPGLQVIGQPAEA